MTASSSTVWVLKYDPRQGAGLYAMPGERVLWNNAIYVKQGMGNTDWIPGTEAYGGGGGESSGNVDGGSPTSTYGGSISIDGGGP